MVPLARARLVKGVRYHGRTDSPFRALLHGTPAVSFALGAIATVLILALALIWVAQMPRASFSIAKVDGGEQVSLNGHILPITAEVKIANAAAQIDFSIPAGDLIDYKEPRGTRAQRDAFYARRDAVADILVRPGTMLILPDGSSVAISTLEVGWPSADAFITMLSGVGTALVGLWLICIRPAEHATRALAVTAIAFYLNSLILAAMQVSSAAVSGTFSSRLLLANYMVAVLIGLGLIDLFSRYPLALVPRRWLIVLWVALPGAMLAMLLARIDHLYTIVDMVMLLLALVITGLLGLQIRATRHRPDIMAAFRWIGSTLLLSISVAVFFSILPQLAGQQSIHAISFSLPLFTLFFLALGMAVMRYRLFDLGKWSAQIVRTALILMMVLAFDFALAIVLGTTWTLSIALLLAALIWIPLRERALRRAERARGVENIALLRHANQVAFSPAGQEQDAAWLSFLKAQFEPLTAQAESCSAVSIAMDGRALRVPSPLGQEGVLLSFAANGARLFNSTDVAIAEAMVRLVAEIAQARDAYDKGAETERLRIARDLHDDVGARLMTSLYRRDITSAQTDVQQAISDMRIIIDGLSGRRRRLADSLADLRHETVSRLQLASIATEWPLTDFPDDDAVIDHRANRVLHSVTREIISNIIRHAGAYSARIEVQVEPHFIGLMIQDDGRGMASADLPASGNGLANMHKRLAEIGGTIVHEPTPKGSRLRAMIPLASPEQGMA